ncbi:phosphatidate cytidylyltransferase [Rivibacter subsaxonicus]|uniref:Phosphatidate cytidylyltransferase n=1 Tax=Rivibacter subsaxonicus TaxID=457575 RepID=A0A4Q7VG43_9BURK|nr:phosphatidate cytidylyltransferase [Rivibacter subsaxonicus]RZT94964.1 phosphatidate cytidylyltransferase [Rivibacter subsaxonicus]
MIHPRNLDTGQQIGLLFIILFGVLLVATAAAFFVSLREHTEQQEGRHRRFKRDLRAVWVSATLFWLAWISGPLGATLLFGGFSFLALREYITLMHTRRSDHRSLILAFFFILPVQYALVGTRHFDLFSVFIPVYMFLLVPVVSALSGDPERFLERNAKIQWGIMVCIFGLSHTPALLLLDFPRIQGRGAFLVFFMVFVVATAQIVQEAASRRLRRRPVARQISRSFSYRAWMIGAFSAAFVGGLLYWITPFKAGQAMVMALIASAAGTMGEFVMKALKRDAGVRYWGNRSSVTGAVGLLDRIAPLCFAAPVFFHSVRWYFGLGTGNGP